MTTNNIPSTAFTAEQDAKVDYYVVKYFIATNPLQPVELQVKVPTIEITDLFANTKYGFQVNFSKNFLFEFFVQFFIIFRSDHYFINSGGAPGVQLFNLKLAVRPLRRPMAKMNLG